jgi:hypothetical protein
VERKHRPWANLDVYRIAAELTVSPDTVRRVLRGGDIGSLPRQRVYRLLAAENRLHWIEKEAERA